MLAVVTLGLKFSIYQFQDLSITLPPSWWILSIDSGDELLECLGSKLLLRLIVWLMDSVSGSVVAVTTDEVERYPKELLSLVWDMHFLEKGINLITGVGICLTSCVTLLMTPFLELSFILLIFKRRLSVECSFLNLTILLSFFWYHDVLTISFLAFVVDKLMSSR